MEVGKALTNEEEQSFLRHARTSEDVLKSSRKQRGNKTSLARYIRLLIELALVAIIAFLLFFRSEPGCERLKKTPVPQFPRKTYTFWNDPKYTREDMFMNRSTTLHTLHNWIDLSSASRGYVVIPDSTPYDLPTPYTVALDRHNEGPGYMMSVFHQLHCLSYLAEHYQQGYGGIELTKEVAHHSAHCFNYVRQGITCNADTTLEGKTEAGPGEGSEHECVDYDALLNWANDNAAYKWRSGLLPEEAVL